MCITRQSCPPLGVCLIPGILVVGLPSREHDRVAASAEKLVRQQLWEGGFYWGTWGANKDGIQRRGNEGVDRTSSQGTSRSAPDGSLWIEAMCTTKPLFVFEVALSEEYDHAYDKCKMWMTQHNGLIKFAVLINIEKWKRKETKNDSSGGEGPVSPLRDSRKRSLPADNSDEPGKRARSVPANTQPSGVPDMEFQEGEDLTDIEDLEEFEPKDATGPRPKTHKFKRVTVSVFGTKMTDSGRMMTTVVPTLEIWPAKPADSNTWQLSWADINPKTPDEHKDKKVQVTFASLHDFLVTEMRRHEPQADPAIALDEDPVSTAQASGSEYSPGESVVEALGAERRAPSARLAKKED
ncbi:hypothetical protein K440DRAFT_302600 [Wilcoxina mikolae CBS 423.85]|nr:hypothetical protein K440DRAFT_302600 [Wilcoxina mikolae CBS 423.85]